MEETGTMMTATFCPECATVIYKEVEVDSFKGLYLVHAGTLVEGLEVEPPRAELFAENRQAWLPALKDVRQMGEFTLGEE